MDIAPEKLRTTILLGRALGGAHDGIDSAIAVSAQALAEAMQARLAAGRAVSMDGQEELDLLIGGLSQLAAARKSFIDAHRGSSALGRRHGFLTVAEGDGVPKPNYDLQPVPDERRMA